MATRAKIGVLQAILTANAKQFNAEIAAARKRLGGFGKSMSRLGGQMKSVGRGMSMSMTLPIVGMGAMIAKTAGQFESSMNYVRALTKATGDDFAALQRRARDLGRDTQFSASEAADAMGLLAQAGLNQNEILSASADVLNLAAAAKLGLAEATDRALKVMSGYGMKVKDLSRVNDVLAKTASSVNTTIVDLSEAFFKSGPLARAAGMKFETMSAVLGQLQDAGMQGAEAGTALKAILGGILKPGENAAKIFKGLGANLKTSKGKMVDFSIVMEALKPIAGDAGALMELFGRRGGPGMAALLGKGTAAVRDLETALYSAGGEAERIARERMKGLDGALKQLKSAFEELQLVIADSGLLDFLTQVVTKITIFFREISKASPETVKWGVAIAGVAAAMGPLIWAAGLVVGAIGTVITVLAPVGAALLALATGPIGIAVAAIAGLGLAWSTYGAGLQKMFPEVTALLKETFDFAGEVLVWFGEKVVAAVTLVAKWFGVELGGSFDTLRGYFDDIKTHIPAILNIVKSSIESLAKNLRTGLGILRGEWDRGGTTIITAVTLMVDGIKAQLLGRLTKIFFTVKEKVDGVGDFFKGLWDKVTRHSYVPNMVDDIRDEFGRLGRDMVSPASLATGKVGDVFEQLRDRIRGAMRNISSSLMSAATSKFSGYLSAALSGMFGGGRGGGDGFTASSGGSFAYAAAGGVLSRATMVAPGVIGGEAGPEALLPLASMGGVLGVRGTVGDVNITVVDNRAHGAPVDVQERDTTGGGKEILLFIRDTVRRGLRSGEYDSEMRGTFGVDRKGLRR